MKEKKTEENFANKGITLIVLIITIIVMVILAGISITTLVGDNGILSKTNSAKEQKEIAQEKEQIALALSAIKTEGSEINADKFKKEIEKASNEEVTVVKEGEVAKVNEDMEEGYKVASLRVAAVTGTDRVTHYEGIYIVTFKKSGRAYRVDVNKGTIELVSAVEEVEPSRIEDWEYGIEDDGTITIYEYTGNDTEVVIPNYIGGIPVRKLQYRPYTSSKWEWDESSSSYYYYDYTTPTDRNHGNIFNAEIYNKITKVTISEGIETIGMSAFIGCSSLEEITIPNSVTSIRENAFTRCTSLTKIILPNSVTSIGYEAFENCTSLKEITIPNSVTSIGHGAFENCTSLAKVILPNSVTSIEYDTFYNCTSLTKITIPNSVKRLGQAAFRGCSLLTEVIIQEGVTSIIAEAFADCSSLTKITIPNTVNVIGPGAFYGCKSLTEITIPNSVTTIVYAFEGCDNLTITVDKTEEECNGFYDEWNCGRPVIYKEP